MTTNRIGWALNEYTFNVKAGSSGGYQFTLTVTQADDSALPSYDGWTATIAFFLGYASTAALTLTPSVTGDDVAKTLTFDVSLDPADTASLKPGNYVGSVWMTDPSDSGQYCPAQLTLTVENHNV
jgi:hypothetical protein